METTLAHVEGDATAQDANNTPTVLPHVVNTAGLWGRGFVCALSRKWKEPEQAYRDWYYEKFDDDAGKFALGNVQFVRVTPNLVVANMIAQYGIKTDKNPIPIRYDALEDCLNKVGTYAGKSGASVVMPRIGCGLAGGAWIDIEPIIERCLCNRGIPVTVYHWQPRRPLS